MMALFRDIYERRELLWILVARNLKIRYKSSALGFFWTLLNPIFLIVIYATFLSILKFNPGTPEFLPMLVIGIIVWQCLAMCIGDSMQTILGNSTLIKKTAFPRIVLPLAMVKANFVNFLLSSVVLVVYLQVVNMPISAAYWLPVVMLTHFALCLGVSLVLSCSNVFFRDTEHIVSVLMLAWFFMTPIIYPFDYIPARFQALAFLNPLTGVVTAYRGILMSSDTAGPGLLVMSFLVSWLGLVVGILVFQKLQVRFAEEM